MKRECKVCKKEANLVEIKGYDICKSCIVNHTTLSFLKTFSSSKIADYIANAKSERIYCPYCSSESYRSYMLKSESASCITLVLECGNCKNSWIEDYTLIYIRVMEK